MIYLAASIVAMTAVLGIVLTIATLPGIWFMLLASLLCWWWQPGLFEWYTVLAALLVAIGAEVAEFFASAAGSKTAGGSKWGAIGSLVGSLIGAIVGTPVFPVVGTIIGAVLGAGVGALVGEYGVAQRPIGESYRSGKGAAVGRLLSTIIKAWFASVVALILVLGAFVPVL
jgi:uncharacterized protein YqgC (DUF456 family)